MAVLSELISFPAWAAAGSAVAIVVAAVLIRRLAKRQIVAVVGIALLAVASILGPALLRAIAGSPDRREAVAADDTAAERAALERRRAELSAQAMAPGSTLACLDALAGEPVETACESSVFASPASTAVAVSYAAARLRLLADGVAFARRAGPSYLASLAESRLAVENDAYGIYAHVLATRDGCTPERCDAFALLQNPSALKLHLSRRLYANVIARHSKGWGTYEGSSAAAPGTAAQKPAVPSAARATVARATSASVSVAAVPAPRVRPIGMAHMAPARAAPVTQLAAGFAHPLWLASATVAIATMTAGPPAEALPDAADATPAAAQRVAAAPEQNASAGEASASDDPAVAAYARQERARGVVPLAASVLTHVEYPSAASIPPISIMAEEPKLPTEPAPSTAPVPASRPQ